MGPFARCCNADLWYPVRDMGEIGEDIPASQSDSEGSNSSVDLGELSSNKTASKCRWVGCGRWFGHLDLLASHVTRVHAACGQGGLFYCGWEGCTRGDRGFNARYKMLVHVRTHTNEKPHHCFKCDKSFSRAENLKIHARSHTGERPYVCPVPGCGKAYSNSSDRFKHTRTHSVDKPYMCKVPGCPKRYTDPSSLRKHVKTFRHFQEVTQQDTQNQDSVNQLIETHVGKQAALSVNTRMSISENEEESMDTNVSKTGTELFSPHCSETLDTTIDNKGCEANEDTKLTEVANYSLDPLYPYWPRQQYGLFCSWFSVWRHPLEQSLTSPEQDLPLDLTVHRQTART